MNKLLKSELGFQGFVMTDWQAHSNGVSSALAGLDMSMPGDTTFGSGASYWGTNLTIAVLNGSVPLWRVDDMAIRIMTSFYKVNLGARFAPNFNSWTTDVYGPIHAILGDASPVGLVNYEVDVRGDHASVIHELGAKSVVLLKNKGALPLTGKEPFVAVIGEDAGSNPNGPNGAEDRGSDDGTLAMGWGSGTTNFPYLVTPEEAIKREVLAGGVGEVSSITNNSAVQQINTLARQAR